MTVRELVVLLGFKGDLSGADKFDARLTQLQRNAERKAAEVSVVATRLATVATAAIGAAIGAATAATVTAGDALTTTMNRIGSAVSGPEAAARAYELLYQSARQTGVAIQETSAAFLRFAPAMEKAGYDTAATVTLLDGLQKGLLAAGSSAAKAGQVIGQLGEAINSGEFSGDELKTFLENSSPTLINAFAAAIGKTSEELKKLGSEGKLTRAIVLPGLIAAARAGALEFGKMKTTFGQAMATMRVAALDFLGKFDDQIGLTRLLVRWTTALGNAIERWRDRLPAVGALVNRLGGLERVLGVVGPALGIVTAALILMNRALTAALIRVALLALPFTALVAAAALASAVVQDFILWLRGNTSGTVFGSLLGDFNTLGARFSAMVGRWRDYLLGAVTAFRDAFLEKLDTIRGALLGLAADAGKAFRDKIFDNLPAWMQRLVNGVGGAGGGTPGPDALGNPLGNPLGGPALEVPTPTPGLLPDFFRQFGNAVRLGATPMPDVSGRLAGSTFNAQNTLSQTVNQSVTVNATGVDGASVAAASRQGAAQGGRTAVDSFGEFARALGMANPRVEAAAQ